MNAQVPAGAKRPASVPEGYLITPFGYFHPSCVLRLAKGDSLLQDLGVIRHANGSSDAIPVCSYQHFDTKGNAASVGHGQEKSPTISGDQWIEDESLIANSEFGELVADWIVPPTPTTNDGQTVFFFPGLEQSGNDLTIIQPVLGWNADFPGAWGIASWNCCYNNNNIESNPVSVTPGDSIVGTVQSACPAGTPSCGSWNITTSDFTTGGSTALSQTTSYGQFFNWAFAGTLEVYNIAQCSDYPPNGSLAFSNLALYDDNFNLISGPSWSLDNWYTGLSPQCNYGAQETSQQVTLVYGSPTPNLPAPSISSSGFCNIFGRRLSCNCHADMTDGNRSASIYYTTDGSTPTTSSTPYIGQIAFTASETFEAIAVVGSSQSEVAMLPTQYPPCSSGAD